MLTLDLRKAKHVRFLKLETWKKAWIFKGASIFEDVLEIGVLEESLYLQRRFNLLEVEDLEESLDLQWSFNLRRSNSTVSDPTSTGGRLRFCRQIHRPGRSDRTPSSFGGVILPSAIQLLSVDDRAFAVRSPALVGAIGHLRHLERGGTAVSDPTSIGGRSSFCRQIHRPGRSDRAPLSFGEVVLPSAIQLLSRDDRAFTVRSTALVGLIGHLRRLER
ncbi:hypothetical protein E5676_scaffold124G00430 [Cucumis melo var. makuwa]|uniref:Uncharacterized protein n=1 Tax=Cucumis melo var. makuwa TaxID=1194695 RepID=A0A5D3DSR8_CUCMM|nr:hypothetical protein E5676_scaffold124G00430 [Cucumis melo var. makuwa]